MRVLPLLLALGACAPLHFDVDVEVERDRVTVWFRPDFATACDPQPRFPHPGECEHYTDDLSCSEDNDHCFHRVALERDGVALDQRLDADSWRRIVILSDEHFVAPGVELVLEGCGGETRIPLPASPAPSIEIQDLSTDGASLYGSWSSDGAPTGVLAHLGYGFSSDSCHQAGAAGALLALDGTSSRAGLYVASVIGDTPRTTPWGAAQVWNTRMGDGIEVAIPGRPVEPDTAWWFDRVVEATTDASFFATLDRVLLSPDATGTLQVGLAGSFFEYRAGVSTDSLRIQIPEGTYNGTFPHVAPTNRLDLAFDGDQTFELDIGTVTLTNEADPTDTRAVTFSTSFDHPYIVRPIP